MQTTHKVQGSDADKYATYLTSTSERGDYYIDPADETGEGAVGEWHGNPVVLASLGLSPDMVVQPDQLLSLMNGHAPNDGRELRAAGGDGTRVAGIDMSFSPPKDVSALWAASSPEYREGIEAAHKDAVTSAMSRFERDVELVRVREGGELKWQTAKGVVAAKFMHNASRLTATQEKDGVPDPQLHTHVVVLAAERHDGKFAAVDSRQVFLSARENGAWYRSVLAQNLQELGVKVERGTGKDERYFQVKGIPKELAERWSTRTSQIRQAARDFRTQYGREPNARELAELTTGTRGTKSSLAPEKVDAAWRELAAEHDLTQERAHSIFNTPENTRTPDTTVRQGEGPPAGFSQKLIERVTAKSSTVSERELYATAYEASAGVCHPRDAQTLVKDLARSGELIQLQGGKRTTRQLREREQKTIATIKERADERAAPVSDQSLRDAEREVAREIGGPLSKEQHQALQTITGEGGITTLIGQAGTGKGVVLQAATNAWQKDGYTVLGTAIAGATAERFGADAKTDQSLTTDSLLGAVRADMLNLDKNTVVVMDEAGMADTNRLSRLVQQTAEKESKLVLVGDSAQLSPIGAGGLFDHVADCAPNAQLTEVHRAENQWEREAWAQVRAGDTTTAALAAYQAHDRLHITDTRQQAAEKMVAAWNEQRLEQPEGRTVMLSDNTNDELDQLNKHAQEYRDLAGELGNDRANLPDAPYQLAAGDHVIFTKPLFQPGGQARVENGTLGTVKDIQDQNKLTIDTHGAKQREVHVDTREFKDLRLGYAQHVYKAQGLTTNTAFALIGGWQTDRERAYVALTRAREQTNIYVSRDNLGTQGMNPEAIERLAEKIEQSNAQQASVTHQPAADRNLEQTTEITPGQTIEDGVGPAAPNGPDPSADLYDRETAESSREQQAERDAYQPTHEQPDERDHDHAHDSGIEID